MSPRHVRALATAGLLGSLALWPIAHATGWIRSVVFVNELSLAAIVLCFVVWVVTAHLDVKRDEEDIPGEVVDRIKDDPDLPG